jgi:predicted RNA-binding protein with PIN domain
MARVLIVDGHSVVFAWRELRDLHGRSQIGARERLVSRLTCYQDATGIKVVVVFDGRGARLTDDRNPGGIQVFYSAAGQTADTVIERLVVKYAGEHDITVATDDGMEQQTVISFGGMAIGTETLRGLLDDAEREVRTAIAKHRAL